MKKLLLLLPFLFSFYLAFTTVVYAGNANGSPCSYDTDCASGWCYTYGPGEDGTTGTCMDVSKKLGIGVTCYTDDDCASGYCPGGDSLGDQGKCTAYPNPKPNGQPCNYAYECQSSFCTGTQAQSGTCEDQTSLLPDGATCKKDQECQSRFCLNGKCTSSGQVACSDTNADCSKTQCCNSPSDTCEKILSTESFCITTVATPTATPPPPPPPCITDSNGHCVSVATGFGNVSINVVSAISSVFAILLSFAGGIVLIIIIFAGYRLMRSQGDPEKLKGAREMLTAAIIGLLFIIFSVTILEIIGVNILHLPGFAPGATTPYGGGGGGGHITSH